MCVLTIIGLSYTYNTMWTTQTVTIERMQVNSIISQLTFGYSGYAQLAIGSRFMLI